MIKNKLAKIPLGVKSAVVYTTASVFSKGLSVITVPIFTRLMSTEQIGIVNLFNSWVSMLVVFVNLSLTSGGYSVALQEYSDKRDEYQSSILTLTTIMALILLGTYAIFPNQWHDLTGLSFPLLTLMFVGFIFTPAQEFWLLRQRFEYKYKLAGLLTMGTALVTSIISVIVVINMSSEYPNRLAEGRLFSTQIISYSVAAIIWGYILLRGHKFINLHYWKYSLKISIPLIGYAFALQVLNVSDRTMISRMVGNSEVGIYSTLYTVSSLSLLVWSAINSAFIPYLFQNIENRDNKIKTISTSLMGAYAAIAVLLTFFAPEIVRILATEEYYEAIYIMPPIAGGVFLTSVSNMYSNVLVYYKRTKYIMYAAVVAAILNVVLNYFGIRAFGYMAAAYTTLIAYVVMSIMLAHYANKIRFKMTEKGNTVYDDRKVLLMSVASIAICLSCLVWYYNTTVRYVLICVLAFAAIFIGKKTFKTLKQKWEK